MSEQAQDRQAEREAFSRQMRSGGVALTTDRLRALGPVGRAELVALVDGLQLDRERAELGDVALAFRRLARLDTPTLEGLRDVAVALHLAINTELCSRKPDADEESPAA